MDYRKETTDYGVTVFSAKQPDYDHELQVAVAANGLVARISMHPTPREDSRTQISRDDYKTAYNLATITFTDFLNINP